MSYRDIFYFLSHSSLLFNTLLDIVQITVFSDILKLGSVQESFPLGIGKELKFEERYASIVIENL